MYGYTSMLFFFLPFFTKGNNFNDFLFASLEEEALQKWRKGLTHRGEKSFLLELILTEKTGRNENDRVASLESALIHLSLLSFSHAYLKHIHYTVELQWL